MKAKLLLFLFGLFFAVSFIASAPYAQEETLSGDTTGDLEQVEEKEGYVTFDFKNADIRNVLRIFSHKTGINIVAGKEVTGTVTITLRDVPWEKALKLVLNINGYGYVRDGNVIKVLTLEQLAQEPLETKVYTLNYAKPADVKATIEKILTERGMINIDERAGLLIVTDVPSKFKDLDLVIARIDTPTPQVLIEGQVVETTFDNYDKLGIKWNFLEEYTVGFDSGATLWSYNKTRTQTDANEWGTESSGSRSYTYYPNREDINWRRYGGLSTWRNTGWSISDSLTDNSNAQVSIETTVAKTAVLSAAQANLVLSYLLRDSVTDILSSPHVVTTNNQEAEIMVGEQYPIANYQFNEDTGNLEVQGFDYKDIGIMLKVTPKVSPDGYITMVLEPTISERGASVSFGGSAGTTVPIINSESLKTTVLVKDGNTLVIGGLIKQNDTWANSKVRFLGDVPLLGNFFRHKSKVIEKRNLIVFITPTIIKMENAQDITKRKEEEYTKDRKAFLDRYNTELFPNVKTE